MPDPDKTIAERLTLVSDLHHLRLDPPVFVQAGQRYWVDWDNKCLKVESIEGTIVSHTGFRPSDPDAPR